MRATDQQDIAPLFHAFIATAPKGCLFRGILFVLLLSVGSVVTLMMSIAKAPMDLLTDFSHLFLVIFNSGGWHPVLVICGFCSLFALIYVRGRRQQVQLLRQYTELITHTEPEQVTLTLRIAKPHFWGASCDAICEPFTGKPWVLQVKKIAPTLVQRLRTSDGAPLHATLYRSEDLTTPMVAVVDDAPIILLRTQQEAHAFWRQLAPPPRRLSVLGVLMIWFSSIISASIVSFPVSLALAGVIVEVSKLHSIGEMLMVGLVIVIPTAGISVLFLKFMLMPEARSAKQALHLLRNGCVGVGVVEDIQPSRPATTFRPSEQTVTIRIVSADIPQAVTTTFIGSDPTYHPGNAYALIYDPDAPQCPHQLTKTVEALRICLKPIPWQEIPIYLFGVLILATFVAMVPMFWWVMLTKPN